MTSAQAERNMSAAETPATQEPTPEWYNPPVKPEPEPIIDDGAAMAAAYEVELAPRQRRGAGVVVAVVSGKPGTGKSTLAANLACAIARDHGMAVAVVDLSLQFSDQALMFDAGSSPSMIDVLANIDSLTPDFMLECMHQAHGLRILGAPPSPELADLVNANHLNQIIDQLKMIFDFVVLDTSSHLSDISLEAIDSADSLVLPAIKMGRDVLEANLKFPISHVPGLLVDSVTDGVPLVLSKPTPTGATGLPSWPD
jgi:cellulose biosynthesis protein BcsQ